MIYCKYNGNVYLSVRFFHLDIFGGIFYVSFSVNITLLYVSVYLHYSRFIIICYVFRHRGLIVRQHTHLCDIHVTPVKIRVLCTVMSPVHYTKHITK